MNQIKVISTGYYLPSKVVDNHYFESIVDTSDEWIVTRTGIKQRRFCTSESTVDLAYNAAKDAINKGNVDKKDIGLIVVATMTPDFLTPSVACMVCHRLGLDNSEVMAFDISAACSGFIYGLTTTIPLLKSLDKKYALVIGSERLSSLLDFDDRNTCILFGDGAGAMIVSNNGKQMISYQNCLGDDEVLYARREEGIMKMDGREVFKFAIKVIVEAIDEVLKKANLNLDDIDYFVCHQANERIIKHVYKKFKVPSNKFYMNLDRLGNTSGASIPIALSMMDEEGLLKKGHKIICVGFGGGLTYGATLFEW